MKPLGRSLSGANLWPIKEEHLPKAPEGYTWDEVNMVSSSTWRCLRSIETKKSYLWAVRDMQGSLCMGVMSCEGYILRPEEHDTAISILMAKAKLGTERKLY